MWDTSKTTLTSYNTSRSTETIWQTHKITSKNTTTTWATSHTTLTGYNTTKTTSTTYNTTWATSHSTTTVYATSKSTTTTYNTSHTTETVVSTKKITSRNTSTVYATSHATTTTWETSKSTTTTYDTSKTTTTTYSTSKSTLTTWQTKKITSKNTTTTWETSHDTTTTWETSRNTTTTYSTSKSTLTTWQTTRLTTYDTSRSTEKETETSHWFSTVTTTTWEASRNTTRNTSRSTQKSTTTTTTWETGYTLNHSILCDGVNDGLRFLGSNYVHIGPLFVGGGTLAIAFKCTGTTNYSNSYLLHGGWGGGWNWLVNLGYHAQGWFQLRFRHDFSGNNYMAEWGDGADQKPFEIGDWFFASVSYNNDSTGNNAILCYGNYQTNEFDSWTSPYEVSSPTGTDRSMSAAYPAMSYGKTSNSRPFKGNISMVGMWDEFIGPDDIETDIFGEGSPVNMAQWDSSLLFFHDMQSVNGTTITPAEGSTGYNLTMTNGPTTDSGDVPS
tara:strand:- start:560 stop:2056 length:1497 start_codon:yes stop_codon:yes gene_type:complete